MVGGVVAAAIWPAVPLFVFSDPVVLADPGEYLLHHYGFFASVFLAITLSLTPLRRVWSRADWSRRIQKHRRFWGVSVFAFALTHFVFYLLHVGGPAGLAREWTKPFVAVGLASLVILTALAATSTDRMTRALGRLRWKWLHRSVYLVAVLVVYHQISAEKTFPMQVIWIFGPVAVLEGMRIWKAMRPAGR